MTKKIKEMSNEELDEYCEAQRFNHSCRWCPLRDNQNCLKNMLKRFNEEVEVDE